MLLLLVIHVIILVIMGFISALCGVTYDEDDFISMICPFIGIATTIYAIPTAIEKKLDKYDLIDVDFEDVAENASVCTPVPGGVGSVTTSVLAKHLLKAAKARRA